MKDVRVEALKPTRYIAVIECYFDDSGTHKGHEFVTMAGYVSVDASWRQFEVNARTYFSDFGVSCLHSIDFHNTRGEFKNWSGIKKRSFLSGLYNLLAPHVAYGLSVTVLRSQFDRKKAETGLSKNQSAYGFAFNWILDSLLKNKDIQLGVEKFGATLSIKVENGNHNNKELLEAYQYIRSKYSLNKKLKDMSFVGKTDCIAVQMADVVAYFSRRHAKQTEENGRRPVDPDGFLKIICDRVRHEGITIHDVWGHDGPPNHG